MIRIEKEAQKTYSYLENHTLKLGEKTLANSVPSLKIDANDVKASHGATTGRVDDMQVYYLKSRGFNELEAKNLIVEGFLRTALSRIQDEKVRSKVSVTLGL